MVMMEKTKVKCTRMDSEELFFAQQEQEQIMRLREEAAKRAEQEYRDEHACHCFRCGTRSLVEVNHGDITIDVCVNEGCGAVHLDPGELEKIENDAMSVKKIHMAVFNIFK